jgi:hypothetical protein
MIDEDQPQRHSAKQVEPQFALAGHRQRNRRRGGRRSLVVAGRGLAIAERRSGNWIGNGRHLAPLV